MANWKLNVDQVLAEIGNPVTDPTEPGAVQEWMIQNILDSEYNSVDFDEEAAQKAKLLLAQGQLVLPDLEVDSIKLEPIGSNSRRVAQVEIPPEYFPVPLKVVDDHGQELALVKDIEKRVRFSPYVRFMAEVRGYTLLIYPDDTAYVNVWVPNMETVVDFMKGTDPELITRRKQLNDNVIRRARAMLQMLVAEGQRQQTQDFV